MGTRFGTWFIDMVIYHIDIIIRDIDMGYGLMIWEMTVSEWCHLPYRYGISCHSAAGHYPKAPSTAIFTDSHITKVTAPNGGAVQVVPVKPKLKLPGTKRSKLKFDEPLARFAFKFKLCRYTTAA
jgi:hypothetical protein